MKKFAKTVDGLYYDLRKEYGRKGSTGGDQVTEKLEK